MADDCFFTHLCGNSHPNIFFSCVYLFIIIESIIVFCFFQPQFPSQIGPLRNVFVWPDFYPIHQYDKTKIDYALWSLGIRVRNYSVISSLYYYTKQYDRLQDCRNIIYSIIMKMICCWTKNKFISITIDILE